VSKMQGEKVMGSDNGLQEWQRELLKLRERVSGSFEGRAPDKGSVLVWAVVPGAIQLFERDMFWALLARDHGYDAVVVLCNGGLPTCILKGPGEGRDSKACRNCRRIGREVVEAAGMRFVHLEDLLDGVALADAASAATKLSGDADEKDRYLGAEVWGHAIGSLSRLVRCSMTESVDRHREDIPQYMLSACMVARAATTAIQIYDPEMIFLSHGTYIEWGPMLDVALHNGRPVCRYLGGVLENHAILKVIFSPEENRPNFLTPAEWGRSAEIPLDDVQEATLDQYVEIYKTQDVSRQSYFTQETPDMGELRRQLGVSGDKPVWCLFTHLVWDAVLSGKMIYGDVSEWLIDTCRVIREADDVHWLIKVHPSEFVNRTTYGALQQVEDFFGGDMPDHISVVPPDFRVNVFYLHEIISGGVTVFGTAGVELALLGKPVIAAGESHYVGKGFSHDCADIEEYRAMVKNAAQFAPLTREQRSLARIYGYSFFHDRQIPLNFRALLDSRDKPAWQASAGGLFEGIMRAAFRGMSACISRSCLAASAKELR